MYNLNVDGSLGRDIIVRVSAVNILEVKQHWGNSVDIAIHCRGCDTPVYVNNLSTHNYIAFQEVLDNDANSIR